MQARVFRSVLLSGLLCTASAGAQAFFRSGFEDGDVFTREDAARFLQQATFGPTLDDIDHLHAIGIDAWIDEQMALPPSYELPYVEWIDTQNGNAFQNNDTRVEAWLMHVLGGPNPANPLEVPRDQLRQRVAFALSQIFVVSDRLAAIGSYPETMIDWYDDVLIDNAFGNYRELLEEVTLHPAMGKYLSMFRNRAPDQVLNIRPDENYAREVMQLFSIGLVMLHPNGEPVLDGAGDPVPSYDQHDIRGFAHVFTGWNWAGCAPANGGWKYCPDRWIEPMAAYPETGYHDTGAKQLLDYPSAPNGGFVPANGSAQSDLEAALDNLFHHPNVGPFIAKQLIQRLVTSNPTPDYVQRMAAVFDDDGSGERGDLGAVVRAILTDDEARHGHRDPALRERLGKLREPLLRLTHLYRAMDARSADGRFGDVTPEYDFAQTPLRAPSVFNFFMPGYAPPGEVLDAGLVAPEFQLLTDSGVTAQANGLGKRIYYATQGGAHADTLLIDLARDEALAVDAAALVDRYDLLFMAGQMSPAMRALLVDHLDGITAATHGADYARDRIRDALYLIVSSPEYAVQK